MTIELPAIYRERAVFSQTKLEELKRRIGGLTEVGNFTNLTIFGVGSFARGEASEFSDIDLFFLCTGKRDEMPEPRTSELSLFGKVIETARVMGYPNFSNDSQYLKILYSQEILEHMGKSTDDYENYFTARMLLLLESKPLWGEVQYDEIIKEIISSYFRDYPDHEKTFQPVFLLNDICRFWKTLLMNYESKRGGSDYTEKQKTKQKVRNFKLKYSRMTTCFASVASICSYSVPVTDEQVMEQVKLTPRERLESILTRIPQVESAVEQVLKNYAFFLKKTGQSTEDLESNFSDKKKRTDMFQAANDYGESMYQLLVEVDNCHETEGKFLRYLVI